MDLLVSIKDLILVPIVFVFITIWLCILLYYFHCRTELLGFHLSEKAKYKLKLKQYEQEIEEKLKDTEAT